MRGGVCGGGHDGRGQNRCMVKEEKLLMVCYVVRQGCGCCGGAVVNIQASPKALVTSYNPGKTYIYIFCVVVEGW